MIFSQLVVVDWESGLFLGCPEKIGQPKHPTYFRKLVSDFKNRFKIDIQVFDFRKLVSDF